MKHTHVVPPYTTIRIFSLTQIPNVDGARQPKNKKLTDREKEIRELEDGFFEWAAKFGNDPHEILGQIIKRQELYLLWHQFMKTLLTIPRI
jgi:hypothetical protein